MSEREDEELLDGGGARRTRRRRRALMVGPSGFLLEQQEDAARHKKGAPQARRPSASLFDLDLGLLLGDDSGAVVEEGFREGAAFFERPRPDVERHCVFAIVASRGGEAKADRFRLL